MLLLLRLNILLLLLSETTPLQRLLWLRLLLLLLLSFLRWQERSGQHWSSRGRREEESWEIEKENVWSFNFAEGTSSSSRRVGCEEP